MMSLSLLKEDRKQFINIISSMNITDIKHTEITGTKNCKIDFQRRPLRATHRQITGGYKVINF